MLENYPSTATILNAFAPGEPPVCTGSVRSFRAWLWVQASRFAVVSLSFVVLGQSPTAGTTTPAIGNRVLQNLAAIQPVHGQGTRLTSDRVCGGTGQVLSPGGAVAKVLLRIGALENAGLDNLANSVIVM